MEYIGVEHIQPDWNMMEQFYFDTIAPALSLDSLTTSHPISVDVRDPKEIEAIFDHISYKKGASIIHMLEGMVGEAVLRKGLTSYLNKHKFANAVTQDLWSAISEEWEKDPRKNADNEVGFEGNFPVRQMMDTWTLQMGYPIVSFVQHNTSNIYTITQERFLKAMNVSCIIT